MALLDDLNRSLDKAGAIDDRDLAAVTLARLLASSIDAQPLLVERLGPKLTTLLVQLRLTPKSREGVRGDDSGDDGSEAELAGVVDAAG